MLLDGMLYYFAYGSNLHPLRLLQRTACARLVGGATLQHYRLSFHKRGKDGSGKCSLVYSGRAADVVHGAIYRMPGHERRLLDSFEGSGYRVITVLATSAGCHYRCFTYQARKSHAGRRLKPFDWYRELVLRGAELHGFPAGYRQRIRKQPTRFDANRRRTSINKRLLDSMLHYR